MSITCKQAVFIASISSVLLSACSQAMSPTTLSESSTKTTTVIENHAQHANDSSHQAKTTHYQLDPHHSNARFSINHMNTSTVTGGFYELTGTVQFSAKAKTGYAKIDIPIDSLHTVSSQFTKHLKGSDFFDASQYPIATFESTQWHFTDNEVSNVEGTLTMHGKTAPVTLTATSFNCYFSPIAKKTMCGGDFTTTIDRTQWGINKYVLMGIPKEVVLDIEIEAIKQ